VPDLTVLQLVDLANAARGRGRAVRGAANAEPALERAFTCSQRLAVYGTLAPGECNHHLLAGCPGPWVHGVVHGRVVERQFKLFTYDPAAGAIAVQMLTSPGLVAHLPQLDAFERPTHHRILVPVFANGKLLAVANLYAACEPIAPA
jgi:gamma-glutamylcyclotransferase (GGCT)/AIG2-like uncharacterized protein YtfP